MNRSLTVLSYKQEKKLINDIKKGAVAKKKLLEGNLLLVNSLANSYKKYLKQNQDIKLLIDAGIKGLYKAIEKYPVSKNYKFSTYAAMLIRQEIHKLLDLKK